MDKLTDQQLLDNLADAAQKVTVGAQYIHYKNLPYKVLSFVIIEDGNEVGVVYQTLYGTPLTFVRPLSSWLEEVEVDGVKVPRFRKG